MESISLNSLYNTPIDTTPNNETTSEGLEKNPIFKISTPNPNVITIKEEDFESEMELHNSTCEYSSMVKYEKQRNVYSFEQRYNLIKNVNVDGMTIRKVTEHNFI